MNEIPLKKYLSAVRPTRSRDNLDQGRLAGAVVPDQTDNFAGMYGKTDIVQCNNTAVSLADIPQFRQRCLFIFVELRQWLPRLSN
jgi:hypothetical protein